MIFFLELEHVAELWQGSKLLVSQTYHQSVLDLRGSEKIWGRLEFGNV